MSLVALVLLYTVFQVVPFVDVCIWKLLAQAASHATVMWSTAKAWPRSTCTHCGSANALDHRVVASPSTTLDAGKAALSTDDAVAVLPRATLVPKLPAGGLL